MQINGNVVKSERNKRAWSQEHLAGVTNLGLRTVQRIESSGTASCESVQALASAFEIKVEDLSGSSNSYARFIFHRSNINGLIKSTMLGLAAISGVVISAIFISSPSWAEHILLDIEISKDETMISQSQILATTGEESEVLVHDVLHLIIESGATEDGDVSLSTEVYEIFDGESILLAEPKMVVANDEKAMIRFNENDEPGNLIEVHITPHAQ